MASPDLRLYEEFLLLSLHDDKGTLGGTQPKIGLAAAAVAELLLLERIDVEPPKNKLVNVVNPTPTGDPVLDAVLAKIQQGKRRAKIETWIERASRIKDIHHLAARQLVNDEVLHVEEKKFLGLFSSTIYPEINPEPEHAVIAKLEAAIFTDAPIDDRTAILIALAEPTDLLKRTFTAKALRPHKRRIKEIANGTQVGQAARKAIEAINAAIIAAVIVATSAAT